MKYYRPATEADFPDDIKVELVNGMEMSDEVKREIVIGGRSKAIKMLQKQTGRGAYESAKSIKKYQDFLEAKADFDSGVIIYVAY